MGDIRAPSMDWSHPDRASTYKLFKQKACMYFECKDTHLNKQVAHILLMTGDEGVRMYNSWGLPAEAQYDDDDDDDSFAQVAYH